MTNVALITYLTAVLMCEHDGTEAYIDDFKINRLYKYMHERMPWINKSSVYAAFYLLIDTAFFDKHQERLYLPGLGLDHVKDPAFDSMGYIHLHKFLFTVDFYKLELRDKKLVLTLLSRLNNQEKRDPAKLSIDDPKLMQMCKINRPAHLRAILKKLSRYFKIWKLQDKVRAIMLAEKTLEIFSGAMTTIYTESGIKRIRGILKERNMTLADRDIELIAHALNNKNTRHVHLVVQKYISAVKAGIKVKHPAAYIRGLSRNILSKA